MIEDLWQDVRFGARMLAKDPGFTVIAVLVLGLALAAGRLLGSTLYEVSGTDPPVLLQAVFVLASISMAACYLPASRATLTNPTTALRSE